MVRQLQAAGQPLDQRLAASQVQLFVRGQGLEGQEAAANGSGETGQQLGTRLSRGAIAAAAAEAGSDAASSDVDAEGAPLA